MRIPADLHRNSQCFAVVVLAQHHSAVLGQLHQVLARFLQQSRVCRARHRLRYHGRVHDYPVSAGCLEQTQFAPGLDGGHQHRFHPFRANALSSARQTRRVNRRLYLEMGFASEKLAMWVFDPSVDGELIGAVIRMLQIQYAPPPAWEAMPACRSCSQSVRRTSARSLTSQSHRPAAQARVWG